MPRKQIPISQLTRSPLRHEPLSLSLTDRINHLRLTLEEAYPQSMETWLDGFRRDANPESEVLWWERLTRCYLGYTEAKHLSSDQKQAVFRVLFKLAMGSDPQELHLDLAHLPDGAPQELLGLLGLRPE